ncbi:HNH endonuclease [Hymenobacter sp. UV11]|uniref:HNH endonuclease n=1 Tax=Hymenobacter sp. UV11 TaxID=1849735 RepID=UPI00105BC935|nr:HNH endonuclease [Hymenobacter sp. UV11]TFZ68890.1 HNH endonuclease [Hymenobacter sp. UV11]
MSTTYISPALRREVALRAGARCEYCHIQEEISEKHGGATTTENLAYACTFCNWNKGSDIASLATDGTLVRLFHPRLDTWETHFALVGVVIQARTAIGEVTVRLLKFNLPERLMEREALG